MSPPVRVRIAPSPTGDPHVGTAYIALFNYAFAKKHGGKFVLRIEDTDRARSTAASEAAILRALGWVGLAWDEGPDIGGPFGPYRQSERADLYQAEVARLLAGGGAYRCFCTAERLEAVRHEQRRQELFVGYDRLCRGRPDEEGAKRAAAGEPFVVRMKMPLTGETAFIDRLRGAVKFENAQIDDQILLKTDGFPTYHLANVVDDHLMQITHVIRAEEWLSSTPKHVVLYQAFGWQAPEWVHMPLLRNADKSKISKRKNPVSLDYYRDAGFLPEALLNYLGTMGWSISGDREKFTLDEMVAAFDFDRVSLGGPVFDLVKLSAMNAGYLRALSDDEVVRRLRAWRLSDEKLVSLVPLVRERIQRLDEFVPMTDFFFSGDVDYAPVAKELAVKNRTSKEVIDLLAAFGEELDAARDFSVAGLETLARAFAEKSGWSAKELFMLLRLAATGKKATPPLFETLAGLGKELVRRRIRQCTEYIKKLPAPKA
ncbi:MAG TPA: glutamate--tRNA ligase [Polyangia bacterium]|jgi:glutamyl-tRNA synthetase|nr:glutamate--tRNA ligase [Polyangia bacterium]